MNPGKSTVTKPAETARHQEPVSKQGKVGRIPVNWVWHDGVLHALRERLLGERENEMAAAAQPVEAHGMSMADSATDEFDHEMALCLLAREQNMLREVDAAIHRILTGAYGICEDSGKPIPAARLRAVPWTRCTKEAQDKREREGLGLPPGIPPLESIQGSEAAFLAEAENPETDEPLTREIGRHQREASIREGTQEGGDDLGQEIGEEAPEASGAAPSRNWISHVQSSGRRQRPIKP